MQLLPTKMSFVTVGLGAFVLLVTAICVFTYHTTFTSVKVLIGVGLLLFSVFFVFIVLKHYDSMHLFSIYLKWSTRMFLDRKLSILYVPIFFLFFLGFVGIMIWEFTGFWTSGNTEFNPHTQIYHELTGTFPAAMTFFMIVQAIWGLSFIKEACKFKFYF